MRQVDRQDGLHRLAAPGRVGTNFFFSFFLARSSQRGDYPFRFVTERPKEQKWPTGPQENILTLTLWSNWATLLLSLSLSHARSRFSAKPVLNVNHDAHDVAETCSIQLESPLKWNCNCQTRKEDMQYVQYSLAECTLDKRWTWAIPNPRFSVAIFFFPWDLQEWILIAWLINPILICAPTRLATMAATSSSTLYYGLDPAPVPNEVFEWLPRSFDEAGNPSTTSLDPLFRWGWFRTR